MTPILSSTILRTQSDARLALLARQGHERAFEAIVERYRRSMLRFCRRFLPEPRAEDAVQQTFLNAWSALRQGAEVGDLRAWLYRIARNAALDGAKRAGYDYAELTEALALDAAPDSEIERRWVIRETLAGVAALPDNQREALLRTVIEGHSRAEIARDLQLSEGAVRQLVHRARAALRAAATAVTPMPLVGWASSAGHDHGETPVRIAELVAGSGAAGGVLLKTGTAVVAAGAIAVGAGGALDRPAADERAVAASSDPRPDDSVGRDGGGGPAAGIPVRRSTARRTTSSGQSGGDADTAPRRSNRGPGNLNSGPGSVSGGSGSGSAGSGSNGSGSGSGGSGTSDSSDHDEDDSSGSGSTSSGSGSESGSSGSGSDGSGSGSSGSGSSGSGSSGSGSGDDDGDDDNSGSGGGGSSGSGSGGGDDDNSGSGSEDDDDDRDSSGSGSGDDD